MVLKKIHMVSSNNLEYTSSVASNIAIEHEQFQKDLLEMGS